MEWQMKTNPTIPNKVTAADLEQFRNSGKTVTAPFRDLSNSVDVALLLSSKQTREGQVDEFDDRIRKEVENSVCYHHMIADAIEQMFVSPDAELSVDAIASVLEQLVIDVRSGCVTEQSMKATNQQFLAHLKVRESIEVQKAN